MKGVTILMMVFLHLFNQESNVNLCHNLVYIGGITDQGYESGRFLSDTWRLRIV